MRLKLQLNEFFSSYRLFTTSANLLNLISSEEVVSRIQASYPKLAKVLDIDSMDESLASIIYLNKGNFDSIGILARFLDTNVTIYGTDPSTPIYDLQAGITSSQQKISRIVFSKLDYDLSQQLKTGFIDLVRDLLWFIDDTSIECSICFMEIDGEQEKMNESNLNFMEFIKLS